MNCIICETETQSFIDCRFDTCFFLCPACELIFRADKDLFPPEKEKTRYDLHQNSMEDQGYVEYLKSFVNSAVLPFISRPERGLDYGSGPEPVLARLLERDFGYKMDIYDPFYAPRRCFEGKKYNLITCTEVAEHVANPAELFKTLSNHLAPDGILALMTMFHQNSQEHFLNWFYSRDPTHIAFYTPQTMQFLADRHKLKIVYCDNISLVNFTGA